MAIASPTTSAAKRFSFKLTVAANAKSCLPHASGQVKVVPTGVADKMTVAVSGVPGLANYAVSDRQVPAFLPAADCATA
jgi:hypothetical protein